MILWLRSPHRQIIVPKVDGLLGNLEHRASRVNDVKFHNSWKHLMCFSLWLSSRTIHERPTTNITCVRISCFCVTQFPGGFEPTTAILLQPDLSNLSMTKHDKKGIKLSLLSGGWWTHPSISTHHWWIRSYRWSSTVHIHVMLCFRPDLLYLSHTNTQEHLAFVFKVKDTISIHPHVKWLWLALMETCHLGNKNTNVQGFSSSMLWCKQKTVESSLTLKE